MITKDQKKQLFNRLYLLIKFEDLDEKKFIVLNFIDQYVNGAFMEAEKCEMFQYFIMGDGEHLEHNEHIFENMIKAADEVLNL